MNEFKKFTMYDEDTCREYSTNVNVSDDKPDRIIVNVDQVKRFILRTKDRDYNLDFKRLLRDYGIERHRDF
jgi:hypothetical protein